MSFKRIVSLIIFFLKTVYFSPLNNPSVYILAIITGIYFITGDMGKHEVLFLMLVISISSRCMPVFRKNSETIEFSNPSIIQYSFFLPIRKKEFFLAFFLTGTVYALVLLGACFYMGKNVENPPTVPSLCPPKSSTTINPISKETNTTINGISFIPEGANHIGPVQFQIPVNPSIIFGDLARIVIYGHGKIADSVFNGLCISETRQEKDANKFNLFEVKIKSQYYSEFLHSLPKKHDKIMLKLLVICIIVFLLDQIIVYNGVSKNLMLQSGDILIYCSLLLIWIGLFLDILLPESKIFQLSKYLLMFNRYFYYSYFLVILYGILRILICFYSEIKPHENRA